MGVVVVIVVLFMSNGRCGGRRSSSRLCDPLGTVPVVSMGLASRSGLSVLVCLMGMGMIGVGRVVMPLEFHHRCGGDDRCAVSVVISTNSLTIDLEEMLLPDSDSWGGSLLQSNDGRGRGEGKESNLHVDSA
jgi:hypothetical protein